MSIINKNILFSSIAVLVVLLGIVYWGFIIKPEDNIPRKLSPSPISNRYYDSGPQATMSPLDKFYCEKGYKDQYDEIMAETKDMPPDAKAEYLASFPDQEMLNVTSLINQYCR